MKMVRQFPNSHEIIALHLQRVMTFFCFWFNPFNFLNLQPNHTLPMNKMHSFRQRHEELNNFILSANCFMRCCREALLSSNNVEMSKSAWKALAFLLCYSKTKNHLMFNVCVFCN